MASSSNSRLPAAVKGGQGSVSTPANGSKAAGKESATTAAPKKAAAPLSSAAAGTTAARRPSAGAAIGGEGMFAGLMHHKRHSLDEASRTRRASLTDAKPEPGFLGSLWNSYVVGIPKKDTPK